MADYGPFSGIVESLVGKKTPRCPAIERAIREAGMTVNERSGEAYILHFRGDAVRPRREISAFPLADGEMIGFIGLCKCKIGGNDDLETLLAGLALHNRKVLVGGWCGLMDDDDTVCPAIQYAVPAKGLNGEFLCILCTSFITEIARVEGMLRNRRLM